MVAYNVCTNSIELKIKEATRDLIIQSFIKEHLKRLLTFYKSCYLQSKITIETLETEEIIVEQTIMLKLMMIHLVNPRRNMFRRVTILLKGR